MEIIQVNQQLKTCTKCGTEQNVINFYKKSAKKDGYSGTCKKCSNNYKKAWMANPENAQRKKDLDKEYREKNKEKIKEYRKEYHIENREKIIQKSKEWYENNFERARKTRNEYNKEYKNTKEYKLSSRLQQIKRRKITRHSPNKATNKEIKQLIDASTHCYWCNVKLNEDFHIDHYIPIKKGGTHELSNLVISCKTCNLKKHTKDPIEFANSIGKLL